MQKKYIMKHINYKILIALVSFSIGFSQSNQISFNDVSLVTENDFENLEDGKAYSWTGRDGNSYAIKKRGNEKYTGIKYKDKWVKHGVYYKYTKSYDKPSMTYLQVIANYRYGELQGEYRAFNIKKGKRYLDEVVNYSNGIKNGKYVDYDSKDFIYKEGNYDYGLKTGTWTHYYTFTKSIMYEYVYNNCDCMRYEYELDNEAAKKHKKGRLQSVFPMKVKITNFDRLSTYEVTHGVIKYYTWDGEINLKEKFHDNINPIISDCNKALEIQNMLSNPKAQSKKTAFEIYKFVFGEQKAMALGELTEEDIKFSNELYQNLMSQNCIMKYVKTLALSSLTPARALGDIFQALAENTVEGCSEKDITQIMNTWVNYQATPHLRVRLGVRD